jgi:hypothetical protein
MVHPVLTFLVDALLVGAALVVIAEMVREYLASRGTTVGEPCRRGRARGRRAAAYAGGRSWRARPQGRRRVPAGRFSVRA